MLRWFFFSSRRRHTRFDCDWSSDVCSSDLDAEALVDHLVVALRLAALTRQAPHLRLHLADQVFEPGEVGRRLDRKSTRLNSSHSQISYAVFCLKKKKKIRSRSLPCTD